jgi:predicted Zn-dependent protease
VWTASGRSSRAARHRGPRAAAGEAAEGHPGPSPARLGLSREARARQGDGGVPATRYEKGLALNPRFAPAANNLAWVLSEHGADKGKALALAQTAKELAPEDPQVSDTLGWIFYRRGVHQRALALLKDSAAKLPCNTMIQYHLGRVSAQLGDKEAARQARAIAAVSATPFPGQEEARKALAALK